MMIPRVITDPSEEDLIKELISRDVAWKTCETCFERKELVDGKWVCTTPSCQWARSVAKADARFNRRLRRMGHDL